MQSEFRVVFISGPGSMGNLQVQEDIKRQCAEAFLLPIFLPEGSFVQMDDLIVVVGSQEEDVDNGTERPAT